MVKHVILWKFKGDIPAEQKLAIKEGIKSGLEGLKGKVPGIVEIKVNINGLETSNADVMLDSTFTNYDSLKAYSVNPLHVEVANTKVRPFTEVRLCLDFPIE